MTKYDFRAGIISLKTSYNSIKDRLGRLDSVDTSFQNDYVAYYYPTLTIWTNEHNDDIVAFDIYDVKYITNRGIRIGDSVELIDNKYPTLKINTTDREEIEFERVGPYDERFDNYSEYRLYDFMPSNDEGWVLILFTKNEVLTKMFFYVGVSE